MPDRSVTFASSQPRGAAVSANSTSTTVDQASDIERFLSETPPFDQLSAEDRRRVHGSVTLAHYSAGDSILRRLEVPEWLYIVAQGEVEEIDAIGPVARHAQGGAFDARALIQGRSENSFIARGDAACYLLPWQLFMALARSNLTFREHFYAELSRHLDTMVAVQQQREAASFMMGRLSDGALHPPVFVDAGASMGDAARLMQEHDSTAVLVDRCGEVGIFTDRDLRERHVLMGLPLSTPLDELASYGLQTADQEELLFNALLTITKHGIRHLVVTRGEKIVGIFEQADLLRHLASASYIIAGKVESATTESELKEAGSAVPQLIRSLHSRGVKPRYITRIVTDLNRKVFRRLFEQLMPPELQEKCCLIVMGSEGRGEQLLRTDQDNGLILANDVARDAVADVARRFADAVVDLGFPPCPGGVMVTNPLWSKPIDDFRTDLGRWVSATDGESLLNLAILYDATAVGGDDTLLSELKSQLFRLVRHEEAFLGHFAKTTLNFPTPLKWFGRLAPQRDAPHRGEIDVKKGGIFPIVHGVRSLALEHGLTETNTLARIEALSGRGPFSEEFTADLIESFEFLCMVRLREQLHHMDHGEPYDNHIRIDRLNKFERRTLGDSFKVVRDLKTYIIEHFRLQLLV